MTARTSGGITTTYTYDVDGNLTGMSAPGETWTYEWNPLGHLVATTHNGVRTEFLIDPLLLGDVIGEYKGGNLVAHYAHGGGLGARIAPGGGAAFYLFDGGGHTSHLLGSDGATLPLRWTLRHAR
jgi:YD repeat-containing protein